MSISLSVGAGKAYTQIGRIERELRALFGTKGQNSSSVTRGKRDQGRLTAPLRRRVSRAVALTVESVHRELMEETPVYSGWLRSNWELAQGQQPSLTVLPTPSRTKSYLAPTPILASAVDGTKRQWLYNQTKYAASAAAGDNPFSRTGKILSGGGPDWFLNIGQRLSSGVIFRTALSKAIKENV